LTKLLADENIPIKAVEALKHRKIDIASILDISPGLSDREVMDLADREGRVIITFDTDFGRLVFKETQCKRNYSKRFIPESPEQLAERIQYLLTTGIPIEDCFLVVREDSVRTIPFK